MKKLLLILLMAPFVTLAQGLTKVKIGDNVSVKIPKNFTLMNETEIRSKYLSNSLPIAMYGDTERLVDFGVTKNETRWNEQDIEILSSFYKANIADLYTEVKFEKEGIVEINNRKFATFQFISVLKDENNNSIRKKAAIAKYTHILYTISGGSLYVFNFSSPYKLREKWGKVAEDIMQSIMLK